MKIKFLISAIAAAALTACGGGSSDTESSAPSTPKTPTTTIAGTAAVGAALPNATVQAKCANGSGTATTAADGTFTISIADATRPCVLSVVTPDGTTLHSVVEAGTGTAATANITPLTELITASIAGGSTRDFFSSFDAQAQAKLTTDVVSTAVASLKLILTGTVDLAGVDPLKDTLVAAHGNTPGNALDQKLDTLGAALTASQTSLSDLSTAVASNSGSEAGMQTILQPASATCATFRSGKYQKADLTANNVQRFTVDAVKLTRTNDTTGAVEQFQANDTEACRFGNADARLLVSKSGISLERRAGASSLVIPDQTIPLSEIAGDWVALGFERPDGGGTLAPGLIKFTVDSAGKFVSAADCGLSACSPWPAGDLPAVSVNADGGFNLKDSTGSARAFAFKGVDGSIAVVIVHQGGFMIAKRPTPRALPAVGAVSSYWDAVINLNGGTDISEYSNTVTAVDTAANTYTRQRNDGRIDFWRNNVPSNGLRYRPAAPNAAEVIGMNVANTGMTVAISVNPANSFYDISIDRP
ncbi:hypothetical protein [Cupriavidus lacunae]|uniref:Carboxypeptidase regulatory-like domain-containing protein n=1 Tax=Cupriavidus lacunae TaxID=2666307 RepID=A0A370NHE4_9BURK|nr:hypothetical protein [Cupriavidus lacunae]RDK05047.1 hypothetical protein DN412_39170 [Cupriavidus lacunae]